MYRFLLSCCLIAPGLPALAHNPAVPVGAEDAASMRQGRVADPAGPLTLPAALSMALAANSELSAARHELQALEASVLQAGALPNPSLDLSMEDTRQDTRETTLQLSQAIELGGKRAARIRAAERGRAGAAAALDARQAEIRAAVIAAFFDVLAAQERVRLARDAAALAQRATDAASRRVAAGKVSPVEETRARLAASGVRLELVQAGSELASARKRLAGLWGDRSPRFGNAEGELAALPDLPQPGELQRRLAASPFLAMARLEVDRRQAMAQLERSRRIPDLTLSVGVKRSEELGRNQAIVGMSIPLPLFDANRGNILEAVRRADKARDELAVTEIRLDNALALAYETLAGALQAANALREEVLPGAESAYGAAAKGFEAGKFGFLDVLDAQRTLLQAKSEYLRALSEGHRAAADIGRILGKPAPAARP